MKSDSGSSTDEYLSRLFNPANREDVLTEDFEIIEARLAPEEKKRLEHCWKLTKDLYVGNFPGYRSCNTEYHDYNHTCDVFGASARLCDGMLAEGRDLPPELYADICIAAMLHDAGYIQEASDTEGTGAKYTRTHVKRSMEFSRRHREDFHLSEERCDRICLMIAATDLATPIPDIPFEDESTLYAAKVLATGDLLGQMADRTYLEKLLFLYYEFSEAGFPGYETEFDMLRKTLGFYEMTKKRLSETLDGAADLARSHFKARYGLDRNLYIESIERQIDYLGSIMEDSSVNFRKKLKRMDLETISRTHRESVHA
ncbi:MAG TPA: hypothetical protein PL077_02575 [Treponemataceae bacterium]|nr:hypothetical protein [Treponemataceae bacterium]